MVYAATVVAGEAEGGANMFDGSGHWPILDSLNFGGILGIGVLGEDVAEAGTPFKITSGLVEEFGTDRVIDTPISEPGFMGIAVGAAMT